MHDFGVLSYCVVLWCSDNEKFIGMAVISGVVIFFLTRYAAARFHLLPDQYDMQHRPRPVIHNLMCNRSVGTVLFTALGISCAAIGLHGAFRQPDDLFTDEAEVSYFYITCTRTAQVWRCMRTTCHLFLLVQSAHTCVELCMLTKPKLMAKTQTCLLHAWSCMSHPNTSRCVL